MKALLGLEDDYACFEWIEQHDKGDPAAVEMLITDALRTGEWRELPDELHVEYHVRKKQSS